MHLYALQIAYTQPRFVYHKHTHTHETHSHISYTHICVTPLSVPPLVPTLTDSLVCEINKQLYTAAAALLAHLTP